VPVFVDVNPETINLDAAAVEAAINQRTRAIVLVHFAGCPANLDQFSDLCARHKLILIEDCAHAHGAEWKGRRVGSFGQFGSFSFQGSKNMTAGEGGILVTNDADLAERARAISNQGRRTGGAWYEHVTLGTNARLTGFQATLLLNQLDRLPEQIATRRDRAAKLVHGFSQLNGLRPTPRVLDQRVTTHAYHLFSMMFEAAAFGNAGRSQVVKALQAEGLPVTEGYPHPIYQNQLFQNYPHVVHSCAAAVEYCRNSVWLPHNALLADQQWIDDALMAVEKVRAGALEL